VADSGAEMDEAQVRAAVQAAGDALCAAPDPRRSGVTLERFCRDVEDWHTTYRRPTLRQLIGVRVALDQRRTAPVLSRQALGEMIRGLRDLRAALQMRVPAAPSPPAPDIATVEERMDVYAHLLQVADDLRDLRVELTPAPRPCGGCGTQLRGRQQYCSHRCLMRVRRTLERVQNRTPGGREGPW
jgi:hypothetical protein